MQKAIISAFSMVKLPLKNINSDRHADIWCVFSSWLYVQAFNDTHMFIIQTYTWTQSLKKSPTSKLWKWMQFRQLTVKFHSISKMLHSDRFSEQSPPGPQLPAPSVMMQHMRWSHTGQPQSEKIQIHLDSLWTIILSWFSLRVIYGWLNPAAWFSLFVFIWILTQMIDGGVLGCSPIKS